MWYLGAGLSAVRSGQVGSAQRSHEWVLTYSTTEGSAGDGEVLELEIGIKDVAVQLSLAIEPVANALPPEGCLFLDFTHHAAMSDMLRRVMLSVAREDGDQGNTVKTDVFVACLLAGAWYDDVPELPGY